MSTLRRRLDKLDGKNGIVDGRFMMWLKNGETSKQATIRAKEQFGLNYDRVLFLSWMND